MQINQTEYQKPPLMGKGLKPAVMGERKPKIGSYEKQVVLRDFLLAGKRFFLLKPDKELIAVSSNKLANDDQLPQDMKGFLIDVRGELLDYSASPIGGAKIMLDAIYLVLVSGKRRQEFLPKESPRDPKTVGRKKVVPPNKKNLKPEDMVEEIASSSLPEINQALLNEELE